MVYVFLKDFSKDGLRPTERVELIGTDPAGIVVKLKQEHNIIAMFIPYDEIASLRQVIAYDD